ncbi:zinc ribbon domain-containing protein [Myroides pelagicus]|uniref:Putative zinc-ribbon domain-containing protein n=1 Tax=Myroides pelagicus TaxID=270914 RepID=A0A7K1GIY7_9FLAO|nr:hypothetical protein [Myroides pelagicus]MEC4113774.1 hypothetical protein [Myroides pelagicus]MTH28768.1 hypothetical protein [Myroides pelagicus]
MSSNIVHIRCPKCGTFSVNAEVCSQCGQRLNTVQQREEKRLDQERERVAKALAEKPSAIEQFLIKMTKHRWILVRLFFKLIYGIWFTVMAIAMFIAWLIGLIVA